MIFFSGYPEINFSIMLRESDLWAILSLGLAMACVKTHSTASTWLVAAVVAWMIHLAQEREPIRSTKTTTKATSAKVASTVIDRNEEWNLEEDGSSGIADASFLPVFASTRGAQASQIRSSESVRKLREALTQDYFASE